MSGNVSNNGEERERWEGHNGKYCLSDGGVDWRLEIINNCYC